MRWTQDVVSQARATLERSASYADALAEIQGVAGQVVSGFNLAHAFRRHGLNSPSSYVPKRVPPLPPVSPVPRAPPAPQGPGVASFVSADAPAPAPPDAEESALTRVLVIPDVHVPYHHELTWETILAVARDWRPDVLVILGDFADCYAVSDYPKDPGRKLTFADEVAAVNRELDRVRALRVPRVIALEGNHETRLARLVAKQAPALHGTVDIARLFDMRARGFEWVPYGHHTTIGKFSFMHDAGHAGVYAARQSVAAFGGNIVFGHTHRASCHYESTVNGDRHVGWTMGWAGDPEAIDYRHRARVLRENQHGFGVVYVERGSGLGWAHFVPVLAGRAVVDGRVISGRRASP